MEIMERARTTRSVFLATRLGLRGGFSPAGSWTPTDSCARSDFSAASGFKFHRATAFFACARPRLRGATARPRRRNAGPPLSICAAGAWEHRAAIPVDASSRLLNRTNIHPCAPRAPAIRGPRIGASAPGPGFFPRPGYSRRSPPHRHSRPTRIPAGQSRASRRCPRS